ncbi:PREDICTED: nephrocystin-1-like isoform X2 [Acropora digitifera]|uniref:nephrocystin-1-like isoform X2 n=1 Tax=Acropora digitifera TaxID=70779 RepID=UPI00077A6F3D|nr:PREDICTED: nephrocystin-1-like isoform X2 [Acropora digitifera]
MLYKRTSANEKSEVACGWCILKLFEENGSPVPNKTYEIPLNGGTPFDIGVDLDPSVSLKASTNRFQQVVRTNRQPRLTYVTRYSIDMSRVHSVHLLVSTTADRSYHGRRARFPRCW